VPSLSRIASTTPRTFSEQREIRDAICASIHVL
jgi:hypothetical protein